MGGDCDCEGEELDDASVMAEQVEEGEGELAEGDKGDRDCTGDASALVPAVARAAFAADVDPAALLVAGLVLFWLFARRRACSAEPATATNGEAGASDDEEEVVEATETRRGEMAPADARAGLPAVAAVFIGVAARIGVRACGRMLALLLLRAREADDPAVAA
jgi:hypothetical protein